MKSHPTFNYEQQLWNQGLTYIAGIDEVGRGAFAGPVVTAAVILPRQFPQMDEINDSKLLTAKKREKLDIIIKHYALSFSLTEGSLELVNEIGVGKACQQAFVQAVQKLTIQPDHILIDGFYIDDLPKDKQTPIIKGDQKSISIAAASIIAKVYRDDLMRKLSDQFENYMFAKNKGYGTLEHRNAIKQFGLCPLHRTSFDLNKFL